MILNDESLEFIQNAVNVAKLVNIDSILIEPGKIRALSDSRTVCLYQEDIPDFEFGSIGLTRISTFQSRLDIIRTQQDYKIEVNLDDKQNKYVRSLNMISKSTKIGYLCANPVTLEAPTSINDQMKYKIPLVPNAIDLLQRGLMAMQTDIAAIVSDEDGVFFELTDVNNDVFRQQFAAPSEVETNEINGDKKFTAKYNARTLLAIFKEEPNEEAFWVGQRGVLRFPVHGINVYVLPKV